MVYGIVGNIGIVGNVQSVTCRPGDPPNGSNLTLTAKK
jgi:hypothetical protein